MMETTHALLMYPAYEPPYSVPTKRVVFGKGFPSNQNLS